MHTNILRGDKVRLTAFCEGDAATMARWSEDTGYLRLQETNLALPRTKAAIAEDLKQQNESSDTLVFGIRPADGDELLGFVGFYDIEWANQVAWFGIGIGERANWGQGYGSETLQLALKYAFCELNLYGLHLTVIDYNERAIALYEKMGFQREGVFRQFGWRDGKRYDMLLYGILRPEWTE